MSPIGKYVSAFFIVHDNRWLIQESCTRIIILKSSIHQLDLLDVGKNYFKLYKGGPLHFMAMSVLHGPILLVITETLNGRLLTHWANLDSLSLEFEVLMELSKD